VPIIDEVARDLDLKQSQPEEAVEPKPALTQVATTMVDHQTPQQMAAPNGFIPNASLANGTVPNGKNGTAAVEVRIPLESYTRRQQSLGFFASLMERWK
jgi:hypothetical protein